MKSLFLHKSRKGSALLMGIFITVIIILIAIYLLEKIVPFSRDIKGVENGNISYYQANTALNKALLSMSEKDPSIEGSAGVVANGSGSMYQITANSTILPKPGLGNSEYDKNWAILAPGKPIQLVLKNGIDWTSGFTYFSFRVPNLDNNISINETLSGGALPMIQWTLSVSGETLLADGSQVTAATINTTPSINFSSATIKGLTLSGSQDTFNNFYQTKCLSGIKCTLKFSLINPLVLATGENAPYLEYQAYFNTPIPLQTAIIEAQGYIGGFRKNITRFVQQLTTNEAIDFTVFQ